jgi:hypothetical protein
LSLGLVKVRCVRRKLNIENTKETLLPLDNEKAVFAWTQFVSQCSHGLGNRLQGRVSDPLGVFKNLGWGE